MDTNANLHHGNVSSGIGLLNRYTLIQYNESIDLNEMNMGVENGDINGGSCYMNSPTRYASNNHNSVDVKNKRD